ncbi:hypothetical protein MAPG_07172 [Magnaporthiopsis poae ATCC 64411]|uniref:Secretory phospholipase A2 n=1 Tax=Magnaporthiopsis poae (strain ATCC 64411 / 73-15) TaxID=644358 RepID=A0A0C4E3Z0_MAGP6|nr:hypothetical protein MAPG_07172 [Magnaporthiopsis poae ATCC 64411]
MKLTATLALLLGAVTALPIPVALLPRQTAELVALTDRYSFELTLPAFTAKHSARDPPTLDWTTDGCSSSPDNPLSFPFLPACHRHDFGYRNFQIQTRFTESNRLRIDNKFRDDLKYQCASVNSIVRPLCNGLADVYYAAVRAFGGGDATPGLMETDAVLVREYEQKLAVYEAMMEQARQDGIIGA